LKVPIFEESRGVLVALIAVVVGVSCSQDFPSQTLPNKFEYLHFQNGRIIERTAVHEGDPAYDVLVGFLKTPGASWSLDLNTYAPSLSFKSEDMMINCRDDLVIINTA
jgi:hypothetical protein